MSFIDNFVYITSAVGGVIGIYLMFKSKKTGIAILGICLIMACIVSLNDDGDDGGVKPSPSISKARSTKSPDTINPVNKPVLKVAYVDSGDMFFNQQKYTEYCFNVLWTDMPVGKLVYYFIGNKEEDKYYVAHFKSNIWSEFSYWITANGQQNIYLGDFKINDFSNDTLIVLTTESNYDPSKFYSQDNLEDGNLLFHMIF